MVSRSKQMMLALCLGAGLASCDDQPTRAFDNPCDPAVGGACGDASADMAEPDMTETDMGALDMAEVDMAAVDMAEPPVECPTCRQCLGPVCEWSAPEEVTPEPSVVGRDGVIQAEIDTSGALEPGALWIGNLDGDPGNLVETVVLRGGRVEAYGHDGVLRWRTAPLGARLIRGVVDINLDGRREIIVTGTDAMASLNMVDARTGALRWRIDPDPFDTGRPAVGADTVFVADLDRDPARRPELYVTEGGCSDASGGRGRFVAFTFDGDVGADGMFRGVRRRGFGPTPGVNCARHQAIAELADGARRVVMAGNRTINAVDVAPPEGTEASVSVCGVDVCSGRCWSGIASVAAADLDGDGVDEIVAARGRELLVFEERPAAPGDVLPDCAEATPTVLAPRWVFEPPEGTFHSSSMRATSLGCPDVPGAQVLTSWSSAGGAHTAWIVDGVPRFTLEGRLLGVVELAEGQPRGLLLGVGAERDIGSRVELWTLDDACEPQGPRWMRENAALVRRLPDVRRVTRNRREHDATAGAHPPVVLPADDMNPSARVVLVREAFGDEALTPFVAEVVGIDGAPGPVAPLASLPGAVSADCGSLGCTPGAVERGVAVSTSSGRPGGVVQRFDAGLEPVGAPLLAPAGMSEVAVLGPPSAVVAINPSGGLFALGTADGPVTADGVFLGESTADRWSQPVEAADGPALLVRDFTDPDEIAWSLIAVDDDGPRVAWRHAAPAADFRYPQSNRIAAIDVDGDTVDDVLRYERLRRDDVVVECGDAPAEIIAAVDEGCAPYAEPVVPEAGDWRLMAISGRDGECLWSRVLKMPCPGDAPGFEQLAVVGEPAEIMVTQNQSVRRLSLAGDLLSSARMPEWAGPSASRGGRALPTGSEAVPYLLVAGNGPPVGVAADGTPIWRAPVPCESRANVPAAPGDGCGNTAWLDVEAAIVGEYAWTTMGRGLPLMRVHLQAEPTTQWFGVGRGAVREASHPLSLECLAGADPRCAPVPRVTALVAAPGLLEDGSDALLVGADDGSLYALTAAGELAWYRDLGTEVGRPMVVDLDGDGRPSLLVPVGDGHVLHLDARGVPAPSAAWDFEPPSMDPCEDGADVDVTRCEDVLCAAWSPAADQPPYDVRVVGDNNAPLTPWRQVPASHVDACVGGLSLESNVLYRMEIRARRPNAGGPTDYSRSAFTDGVRLSDDEPPVATLTAPACHGLDQGGAELLIEASDDERLAGWSLQIVDAARNEVRVFIPDSPPGEAALNAPQFWDMRDGGERLVAPGVYEARLSVTDSSDQTTTTTTSIDVRAAAAECDAP